MPSERVQLANPTVYNAPVLPVIALVIIYAVLLPVKIIIMAINEPFLGESAIQERDDLARFTEFYFWGLLFINVWPISWIFKGEKEKVKKFSWIIVMKDFAFWLYLLDVASLLICPILLNVPPETYKIQQVLVLLTIVPCGFVYFFIINSYHFINYDPDRNGSELLLQDSYVEFNCSPKICSIRESGPFRIVIENDGYDAITKGTKLFIERTVMWRTETSPGRIRPFLTKVRFCYKFAELLEVGQRIVMIPETHSEPGAVRIADYRSFGNNKGAFVTTCIFCNRERLVTKFTQEYKLPCDGTV